MKRKISSTLAATLITTQMQGVTFAQESIVQTNEKTVVETTIDDNTVVKEVIEDEEQPQDKVEKEQEEQIPENELEEVQDKLEEEEIQEEQQEATETVDENYNPTGKLELDMNFDMPIKHTTKELTDINVALKDSQGKILANISLGKDNTTGTIESTDINYSLEALDGKRKTLEEGEEDLSFYHLTLDNLSLDTYSLEISGQGYKEVTIDDIEILNSSKRVSLGTSHKEIVIDDTVESYEGVFLAGDLDEDGVVTQDDYDLLKDAIKGSKIKFKSTKKFDLNRDGKIDITDLSYVHSNIDKAVGEARIEDTNVIVNLENTDVTITEDIKIDGNIKDLFIDNSNSVKFTLGEDEQESPISKQNPISVPIILNKTQARAKDTTNLEQVVIKAPSENAPSSGNITIPGAGKGGSDLVVDFDNENIKTLKNGEDEIVVDLGKQVAVSKITINITGSRSNKNLTEISKVDFLNNVYKEIPKPKMNVPVINNFTSGTAVGNEFLALGWNHEPNVTGYELKIQEVNENGGVKALEFIEAMKIN